MTQSKFNGENIATKLFQGNSPRFRWFNKETFWPLRSLENFSPQNTKFSAGAEGMNEKILFREWVIRAFDGAFRK